MTPSTPTQARTDYMTTAQMDRTEQFGEVTTRALTAWKAYLDWASACFRLFVPAVPNRDED
jgi:hypothetical protein